MSEQLKLTRRDMLKGAGAVGVLALGLSARPAEAQSIAIRETYANSEEKVALPKGRELFSTLLSNNPHIKEAAGDKMTLSVGYLYGGSRNNVRTIMTYIIHDKALDASGRMFGSIGAPRLLTAQELDKDHPGVLALIPAEKDMTYERFREFFNTFVVKLRASK